LRAQKVLFQAGINISSRGG